MSKIKIQEIRMDGGTQPRSQIDENLVSEYAEIMKNGNNFPPVVIFHDGVDNWLADGFHRVHAARRVGIKEIESELHAGTKRDAILYSVGANAEHGQRRNPIDKRKAVMKLLEDEEWNKWSNREIARRCAVTEITVRRYRDEYTATLSQYKSEERTFTHPKTGKPAIMNTENIGKQNGTSTKMPDKPKSRGKGIRFAHEAINALKKIPDNDGLRDDAFDMVIDWIETNR